MILLIAQKNSEYTNLHLHQMTQRNVLKDFLCETKEL